MLVSIIVPVYKAEKYLNRCVNSILAQTISDFELILVDDGSPDLSGIMCDEFSVKDSRIRVIHQKNSGASAARNRGLDEVRGKYLMFCDSDDAVSPLWIARLLQYADGKTLPVGAYCSKASQLGQKKELAVPCGEKLAGNQYYMFKKAGIAGFICNNLFEADIVKNNGLRFREQHAQGDFNEDLLFMLQYVRHIENIVYTGYADYVYETHQGSLSQSYSCCYFPKYQEKYTLWSSFLGESEAKKDDLEHLAEETLYHFLAVLKLEASSGHFRQFWHIIQSYTMAECLKVSQFPREDPRVIALLRQRAFVRLFLLFAISSLKGNK